MMPIYIRNHDIHKIILRYLPGTGEYWELARTEFPEGQSLARGFYVNAADAVIGVFASSNGPICFRNSEQFALSDGTYSMELVQGENQNVFTLHRQGTVQFTVTYPPAKHKNYGPWADEEMVDFFLWLYASFPDDKFHTYFTVP